MLGEDDAFLELVNHYVKACTGEVCCANLEKFSRFLDSWEGGRTIIAEMKSNVPRTATKRRATSFVDSLSSAFFFASSRVSSFL